MKRGETRGLVGESGCGKSTLGLAMLGFLRSGSQVLSGTLSFQKQNMFKLPYKKLEAIRGKDIALIPQNAGQSLTPTMRVGSQIIEALAFNANLKGQEAQKRAFELFTQVRLPDPKEMLTRYRHELSGGQQQRVAIAMAHILRLRCWSWTNLPPGWM
jgi:peptide/nickel transport system ATP-binding protein